MLQLGCCRPALSRGRWAPRPAQAPAAVRTPAPVLRGCLCAALALLACARGAAGEPSSAKSDADYDFGDYRGKWCLDERGFVYALGETYRPSPRACPCTCTEDGPVCVKPRCPRIHPRCTRVSFRTCCPRCEAVRQVCEYGGRTYRLLEEFMLSPCERCRCGANREVYCTVAECPALHCVDPTFEPHHCCPVCKNGANCFAGNTIIPAGVRVEVDARTVCFCAYKDGTWQIQHQATCQARDRPRGGGREQMETQLFPESVEIP
ncbi:von Willebrand factor C domain-containing protein 2-like [Lepisosteus oculatus]|uniref:von Willebrand factor C domain-containing protein 2-like n=1 Tax=Lepisosteus oculatus TaxID=7918 RepID=UPI00371C3B2B